MVQPLYYRTLYPDSCLTVAVLNASPLSCLLLGCEQVWGLEAVNVVRTSLALSLFRIHFEKLKTIPVLQLDASVEFQSDPEMQEQFITKVY